MRAAERSSVVPMTLQASPEPPTTGVGEVDDALADLRSVFERPVAEQVVAIERGHERLRGALDGPARPH